MASNWTACSESKFPWEQDALNFVRDRFPQDESCRAWANFDFVALDGSLNEVDLLVFSREGFFLVEIKSRPGRLTGDAGTWTWITDGRRFTVDNPLHSANLKAKKLKELLSKQKAFTTSKGRDVPFLEPLVFCSALDLHLELPEAARAKICVRDRERQGDAPPRKGIMAALLQRACPGLSAKPIGGPLDRPLAKLTAQALEQAGVRPSQRMRKVGDYLLKQLVGEAPGCQDWAAEHVQVAESRRRVRLYLVRREAAPEVRATIENAARREFRILESLSHPGILRTYNFTEHELGPALLFEHDPLGIRLDHYLTREQGRLTFEAQLELIRQIAEAVEYAHSKKVYHRALSPQSILVVQADGGAPRIKLFNWQVGARQGTSTTGVSRTVNATSHVERLVEGPETAYMAPEAFGDGPPGEHLDVFSLGALAFRILSGQPPAADAADLAERLRGTNGLRLGAVLDGAGRAIEDAVREATHPQVLDRTDSVGDFLAALDLVQEEFTRPDVDFAADPARAQVNDLLPGMFLVRRRLGQGSTATALLVEQDGQEFVLKVANEPDLNDRIREEADLLAKPEMQHPGIVRFVERHTFGDFVGFTLRPTYVEKESRKIETLGQRLRKDGPLHVDLLQRFGEDLLAAVGHLEEQGIPHRDIKPDNIAVGMVGRGDKLHAVLFDFSLSRTPPEEIRAGTNGYLDPLLPLRRPRRWDNHAERYAVAMTLHELATGVLPKWGDGTTDPSQLAPDVEITLDPEVFPPELRDVLPEFFARACRRGLAERFGNAEEMLRAWRDCFAGLDETGPSPDRADEAGLRARLAEATYDTQIPELGLSSRAANALDRADILTVEDLLTIQLGRLAGLRSVGHKTRREIVAAVRILRERLARPEGDGADPAEAEPPLDPAAAAGLGIDQLAERLLKLAARDGDVHRRIAALLLGLDPELPGEWPSQADIALRLQVSRSRVGQVFGKVLERWCRDTALLRITEEIPERLAPHGGVMSVDELADVLLQARGASAVGEQRRHLAGAVVRGTTEIERALGSARFVVRRERGRVLLAGCAEHAEFAFRLGERADELVREDPLLTPARAVERLREIPPPEAPHALDLPEARLVRLAAAASCDAAVSGRLELYPRGMSALRALKLSVGAWQGQAKIFVDQLRERLVGRYPEAEELPDRPALDVLLREAGLEVRWEYGVNDEDPGCYVPDRPDVPSLTSGTGSFVRRPTNLRRPPPADLDPEEADARLFEERLVRSRTEGSYLALFTAPRTFDKAFAELATRFELDVFDFEAVFLDELEAAAARRKVPFDLVVRTDALPDGPEWDKLLTLVDQTLPAVRTRLYAAPRPQVMVRLELLSRYDRMRLLSDLALDISRGRHPGCWLLLMGDHQAMLSRRPVPLLSPNQRIRIPPSWIANRHRGGTENLG